VLLGLLGKKGGFRYTSKNKLALKVIPKANPPPPCSYQRPTHTRLPEALETQERLGKTMLEGVALCPLYAPHKPSAATAYRGWVPHTQNTKPLTDV